MHINTDSFPFSSNSKNFVIIEKHDLVENGRKKAASVNIKKQKSGSSIKPSSFVLFLTVSYFDSLHFVNFSILENIWKNIIA